MLTLTAVVVVADRPAAAAPAVGLAAGTFAESILWDSADVDRYANHHVQGLAVIRAGTPVPATGGVLADDVVLAFTEGRTALGDDPPKDLLVRRSVDAGHTWSASAPIVSYDGTINYSNMSPLVDDRTGAVFLFYKGSDQSVFFKRSGDAGASWGPAVNLSHLYASNPNNPSNWAVRAPTPGHGIQLDSGRLLMPVFHRAELTDPNRNYGVDMLYSDNGGTTWRRSAPALFSANYPINENRVYQRSDGAVVINGRWGSGGTRYPITSISTDGGATWSAPVVDGAIGQFVATDASVIRYTRGPVNRLLYSRPDSSARENMTVSVSYDEGASYRYSRVVNAGPSYYSDLAALSDGTILLVYGRDYATPSYPARIALARFDLEWLTNGRDSLASGPGFALHDHELASPQARTNAGTSPQFVADPNARGGRRIRYAASTVGNYVEVPFEVATAGGYEVAVRYHRLNDQGRIRASIDGVDLAHGLVDPTMTVAEGFQVYPLGRVALAAGTHLIRFTLASAGRAGGMVIAPDQLMLTSGGAAVVDPPSVFADNGSPASFEVVSGTWDHSATVSGYYGQGYQYHSAGTGTARARFRPDVPIAGVYQVAIRYTAHENRATNTPYVINHADGQAAFRINQEIRGGEWITLGNYSFFAGGAATIEISDDANGNVIADAVRLARVGVAVDNADGDEPTAGFEVVTGEWNKAKTVLPYIGETYRTHPAGTGTAMVRWRPDVPVSGVYQVAVWYTAHANRASNAPYVVNHAGGRTTVRVNQRIQGGQWVSLGSYSFAAGETATIELSDDANGYVVADAVRLTQ